MIEYVSELVHFPTGISNHGEKGLNLIEVCQIFNIPIGPKKRPNSEEMNALRLIVIDEVEKFVVERTKMT